MKKKLLALFVLLTMLVTLFASCGSDSETGSRKEKDKVSERNEDDDDEDDEDDDDGRSLADLIKDKVGGGKEDRPVGKDELQVGRVEEKVINVMSFTDEVPRIVQMYLDWHPELGYSMRSTIVATTDGVYQPALDEMIKSGDVDIYAVESAFAYKYTQGDAAGFAATYDDLGIRTNEMMRASQTAIYASEIGTRPADGKVVGLPYQSGAGCFIYRRSVAKDTWGTDDPRRIQEIIGGGTGSWDLFWDAADDLKAKGYGIVSGDGDVWHGIENSANQSWLVDGVLTLDPKREALLDVSKWLKDNNYHNETQDWQHAWFEDMCGVGEKPVFGFFGPAWFINYTMSYNCGDDKETSSFEGTYGDWAVCNAPVGFWWGGTWVLAHRDVVDMEKKDVVADILQWITLDYDENSLQYLWANGLIDYAGTKDAVVSGTVMSKSDGRLDMLNGQNMFDYYVSANEMARGDNSSQYDEIISTAWRKAVREYVSGWYSRSEAIELFASEVRNKLGITIPDSFYSYSDDGGRIEVLPTPAIKPVKDRDLGGLEIVIGDWYSPEGGMYPTNAKEEAAQKYRQELMLKYNFSIQQKMVSDWSGMGDTLSYEVTNENPSAHVYELDYRFIAEPMKNGLFYDLATLDAFDFSEEKWSDSVTKLMTRGDSIYGMKADFGMSDNVGGVIFNKRLMEEAGFDAHYLYDLQVSGEWTWDTFEAICSRLTRDLNGDGCTDVYAVVGSNADFLNGLVASTGEDFFLQNPDGTVYSNFSSENVLTALDYAENLYSRGYVMPDPEHADWNWYQNAFKEGQAAMTFAGLSYMSNGLYGDMWDELGFVMPPKPDYGAPYHSYTTDSVFVIPACYDTETADAIAFAYNLYTNATPGWEERYVNLDPFYSLFWDERAVEETLNMFAFAENGIHNKAESLLDANFYSELDGLWGDMAVFGKSLRTSLNALGSTWEGIVAEANGY